MADLGKLSTARLLDRDLAQALVAIARKGSELGASSPRLQVSGPGSYRFEVNPLDPDLFNDPRLSDLFGENGYATKRMRLFAEGHYNVEVRRTDNQPTDNADVSATDNADFHVSDKGGKLLAVARRELHEIRISDTSLGPAGSFGHFASAQEAALARLDALAVRLIDDQTKRIAEFERRALDERQKLDEEVRTRRRELEDEATKERTARLDAVQAAEKRVEELRAALEAERAQFDLSHSKGLRRKLREDMLRRLSELATKFELTEGSRKRRLPVHYLLVVLIIGSATIAGWLLFSVGTALSAGNTIDTWAWVSLVIKQVLATAVFLSAIWYYIRWNDSWARQHADAEFRLKQMELDLNRASWVVELAFEWQAENKAALPQELLDRLSRHLFVDPAAIEGEQGGDIASVILGGASSVKFQMGGAQVEMDRRGIKDATRAADRS